MKADVLWRWWFSGYRSRLYRHWSAKTFSITLGSRCPRCSWWRLRNIANGESKKCSKRQLLKCSGRLKSLAGFNNEEQPPPLPFWWCTEGIGPETKIKKFLTED